MRPSFGYRLAFGILIQLPQVNPSFVIRIRGGTIAIYRNFARHLVFVRTNPHISPSSLTNRILSKYRIKTINTNPCRNFLFSQIENHRLSISIRTGKISSINFRPLTRIFVFISGSDQALQTFQFPVKKIFHSRLSLSTLPRQAEIIKVTCRHLPLLRPEGINVRINFLSYTETVKIFRPNNDRVT